MVITESKGRKGTERAHNMVGRVLITQADGPGNFIGLAQRSPEARREPQRFAEGHLQ
jgi:hypothetical protein